MPQTQYRLALVEQWLTEGMSPRQAATRARDEFGIKRRAGFRYVALAFAQWKRESERGRDEKRAHMRATLWAMVQRCLTIETMQVDKYGEEHFVESPDMKAAAKLLETLCRFDGLLEQDVPQGVLVPTELLLALKQHYYGDDGPPEQPATVVDMEVSDGEQSD